VLHIDDRSTYLRKGNAVNDNEPNGSWSPAIIGAAIAALVIIVGAALWLLGVVRIPWPW